MDSLTGLGPWWNLPAARVYRGIPDRLGDYLGNAWGDNPLLLGIMAPGPRYFSLGGQKAPALFVGR
jgi:hypothetical protein